MQAHGDFEVQLVAQGQEPFFEHPTLGRRSIDKQYSGGLNAHALGQMLSAGGGVPGSAGYVAIERVSGELDGRAGSFVLMHRGIMDRGQPQLEVMVVPDSGTDELLGLSGSMQISIDSGRHSYVFDYEFAPT